MKPTMEVIIEKLELIEHPEGGYFREIYRSDEITNKNALPGRYDTERCFSTSIYYLLCGNQTSNFHKLKSDEIWYHQLGSNLIIHCLSELNGYEMIKLGNSFSKNIFPQIVIKKGTWFAAEVENKNSFSLIGCNVAPGFEYSDFELAEKDFLKSQYPDFEMLIEKFTKP